MIKQKWTVTIEDKTYDVEYKYLTFGGKTVLTVDGESFAVSGKPFSLGLERKEPIIVGGVQAMLDIKKNGKATLICREGEVKEA